jgi:hypothetical protein
MTPVKAIRAYCLDCSNNQPKEVKLCPHIACPLYEFRMGKNPNYKKTDDDLHQKADGQGKTPRELGVFEHRTENRSIS